MNEAQLIKDALLAGENSPEEEALTQFYESLDICRSDAQGIVMALFMRVNGARKP